MGPPSTPSHSFSRDRVRAAVLAGNYSNLRTFQYGGMDALPGTSKFRQCFLHFGHFELDVRGHTQAQGAAFSCLRLKLADMVLI